MEGKTIIPVMALLLLAACAPNTGQGLDNTKFYRGTQGVSIDFLEESPPRQVYEGTDFGVIVRLHNDGATDIPYTYEFTDGSGQEGERENIPGRISLSFDDFYLRYPNNTDRDAVEERTNNIEIRGKSDLVPNGEEKVVRITNLQARGVTGQRESPDTQVQVSVCYPYRTRLSTDICMDANNFQRNLREQVCQARDLSFSSGQGAPVAITKVEVDMIPLVQMTKPSFTIHIENTGRGSVLRGFNTMSTLDRLCSMRSDNKNDVNTLDVTAELAGVDLECNPNPVRLAGDKTKFVCNVPSDALDNNPDLFGRQDNFVTSLNVDLEYIYTTSDSTTVEILRKPGNTLQGYEETREEVEEQGPTCGEGDTEGYSCSCTRNKCIDMASGQDLGDCKLNSDYCAAGYCCYRPTCDDYDGEESLCTELDGCDYCETNDQCLTDNEECPEEEDESQS